MPLEARCCAMVVQVWKGMHDTRLQQHGHHVTQIASYDSYRSHLSICCGVRNVWREFCQV